MTSNEKIIEVILSCKTYDQKQYCGQWITDLLVKDLINTADYDYYMGVLMGKRLGPAPKSYAVDKEDDENTLAAVRKSAGLRPIEIITRPCIKCGSKFKSEGAHNRMCQCCRNNYKEE